MTINELREKRNQAWNAAKAFVETKRDKDGLLSDEDSATYAQMEKKVQDYGTEIERMEAMAAMEAQLSKPTSAPITEKPLNGKTTEDKQPKSFRATDAYRSGMLNALRTNFRQISNVLQEGIDANGGYLVPDEYDSRLIQVLNEENVMRSLGTAITTSGEHKINIAATKPAAAWIEEGGALTFGDATFDQIILDAHKLHVAVKVTEELLYDNFDRITVGFFCAWELFEIRLLAVLAYKLIPLRRNFAAGFSFYVGYFCHKCSSNR